MSILDYHSPRITIGNTPIDDVWIAKGSYRVESKRREAGRWTDSYGYEHIRYHQRTKTRISFAIREHDLRHDYLAMPKINVDAESFVIRYWDDKLMQFVDGEFYLESAPALVYLTVDAGENIQYAATQYTFVEF